MSSGVPWAMWWSLHTSTVFQSSMCYSLSCICAFEVRRCKKIKSKCENIQKWDLFTLMFIDIFWKHTGTETSLVAFALPLAQCNSSKRCNDFMNTSIGDELQYKSSYFP